MTDPMTCDTVRSLLSGYVDDALTPAETSAVARHCENCAACRTEHEALRVVRATLRDHLPALVAPDLLRRRIATALRHGEQRDAIPGAAASRNMVWLRQIAAALVVAVVSSAATRAVLRQSAGTPDVAVHDIVAVHVRSLMTDHLTAIVSTDEHSVKPWFDGKVAFEPDVPRLDSVGFPLIGGRVDTIGHDPVAALVYGRRKHVINLFTWPANGGTRTDGALLSGNEHGYNVLRWTRGDMRFAAVSDLAAADLRQFVVAYRQGGSVHGDSPDTSH
jgi:anti-sigma factor RsiW